MDDGALRSDRLTRAAHRTMREAGLAAGAGPIRPEHIFGALARLPSSVAARALGNLGLGWSDLGLPSPPAPPAEGGRAEPELAPATRAFFQQACHEARRLGHHPVGTGHLVLALLSAAAGPLPTGDDRLTHAAFREQVCEVMARPWVHGFALDGEVQLYLTRDELLVLYTHLLRRPGRAGHAAERALMRELEAMVRPVCEELLAREGALERAREAVLRLDGEE